jgi:predicted pyridoxine 5'-phosphate oxidase superfamily flavin-nucleotide-binding protein
VRTNLGPDELDGLLDSLNLAVLATYRKDGTALLSPIWFIYEDAGFTLGVAPATSSSATSSVIRA